MYKRVKGLNSTRVVEGRSVDEQFSVDPCTILPELAPTLADSATETFRLDFTFSSDLLSVLLLWGALQGGGCAT